MCQQKPLTPLFFQKTPMPWNSLGNASLGVLPLNSQLILEKTRITLVKQTKQSQFLHHRTLAQTETGRLPKVLETFSKRQPNTKATTFKSGKILTQ